MSCHKSKVTQLDYKIFKNEFERCRQLLGLTGWDVFYKFEPIDDSVLARVMYMANDCGATVIFNSALSPQLLAQMDMNILKTAKHEAIHLLLARYDHIATCRFVTPDELSQANEEIVVKLTDLIP